MEMNAFKVRPNHLKITLWLINKMATMYVCHKALPYPFKTI